LCSLYCASGATLESAVLAGLLLLPQLLHRYLLL
jgi:hypothetical protein